MSAELARFGSSHRFREKNPDVASIAGARALECGGHTYFSTRYQERQRIALPMLFVEISSKKPARPIRRQRINASHESTRPLRIREIPSLKMTSCNVVSYRNEGLVWTVAALDSRLLADA